MAEKQQSQLVIFLEEIVFYVNEKVNIHEFSKNFLKKFKKSVDIFNFE